METVYLPKFRVGEMAFENKAAWELTCGLPDTIGPNTD